MADPSVRLERRGAVLVVTMDRPQARNAFDADMSAQMEAAMDLLDAEAGLHAAVLTGGPAVFCAGADLKSRGRGERLEGRWRGGFGIFARPPAKPMIAAVEGYAVGGGFQLCLCCDLIVAARSARFVLPEVKRGLVAEGGALFRLPRRLPYHLAMELALLGDGLSAETLHAHGLVNRLVEPGEALAEALRLAERMLEGAPLALQATKAIVERSSGWSEAEAWARQAELARSATESEDAREGPRAFAEKRPPVWTGR